MIRFSKFTTTAAKPQLQPKPQWFGLLCALLFCCCSLHLSAIDSLQLKAAIGKVALQIGDEQIRIDKIDGKEDGRIELNDSAGSDYAGRIYFGLVDSIQRLANNAAFDDLHKKIYLDYLRSILHNINPYTVYLLGRNDKTLHFMLGEMNAVLQNNLFAYLNANMVQSLNTFPLFKGELYADSFLITAAYYYPDLVFKNYDYYYNKYYALRVLEQTAKIAPVTVKRYFNNGEHIFELLKKSSDEAVKIILDINNKFTRKSNAFTLLDDIMNGTYTLDQADEIGGNPKRFLEAMIKIRSRKNPLAVHSLEDDLTTYSLKFIRVLNDLHNEKDEVRFASIEKFTENDLYTLMVYSEEEIFTSTFNGLFNRMMIKLGPISGYEFLSKMGDNRFRTFIKMSAGFGKLTPFLQSMTAFNQQMLMIKFASGLETYNDLSQAVEVADAFGSITDSLVLKILRSTIKLEYLRLSGENNARGKAIYGLLSSLFVDRRITNNNWFASISKQYNLPSFDRIANGKLFDRDSVDRWLIYFYDDEDGEASFSTFLKAFADPTNWKTVDSGTYVIIKSKTGKMVNIYANKSKNEYDGQAELERIFTDGNFEPNVMVHRGHSYYAFKTIEKVKDNTQIFVLGSCGGYHSINSIIERSPEVSIISSKQIGTKFVNNPMLKLMADCIRTGKDIEWENLWKDLGVAVKKDEKPLDKAYERYLDYIPPHKNLGAIFIKTYNKMVEGS